MQSKPLASAIPLRAAMDQSAPLARLVQRLQESNARFEAVRDLLPPALRSKVRPGPLDDEGWSLLAANGAVAAKLRHLVPLIEERLQAAGWSASPPRVKVLNGS